MDGGMDEKPHDVASISSWTSWIQPIVGIFLNASGSGGTGGAAL